MTVSCMEQHIRRQKWLAGKTVGRDGMLEDAPDCAVNALPLRLAAGTVLAPKTEGLTFRFFGYRAQIPPRLIYEYAYQPEANWTVFDRAMGTESFAPGPYTVPEDGYWRVAVTPGAQEMTFSGLFDVQEPAAEEDRPPAWLLAEVRETAQRAASLTTPGAAVFLLTADTHYSVGCPFDETVCALSRMADAVSPLALIHLGDFTDGMLSGDSTRVLSEGIRETLSGIAPAYFACLGNHDHNYFRGNPDRMSAEESARILLGRDGRWYRQDFPDRKLTLFFLDSFDPAEQKRYGFDKREVRWFAAQLRRVPKGHAVIVFSHVPPEAKIHVWSDTIRNGPAMLRVAERFHRRRGGAVLAWIHGHNHAEQIFTEHAFPIVGIGCGKLEAFSEHKPEGSQTMDRRQHIRTQELFDVLIADAAAKTLHFVRFGAGRDRTLSAGEAAHDPS